MVVVIYVAIAAVLAAGVFLVIHIRKGRSKEEADSFVCGDCGSKDCVCEKEDGNQQQDVRIYSLSTCSHCKSVKKLLSECEVRYEFTDVDQLQGEERKAILEDVKKFNPKCSFPTIIIGDTVVVGYREKEIKTALGLQQDQE